MQAHVEAARRQNARMANAMSVLYCWQAGLGHFSPILAMFSPDPLSRIPDPKIVAGSQASGGSSGLHAGGESVLRAPRQGAGRQVVEAQVVIRTP